MFPVFILMSSLIPILSTLVYSHGWLKYTRILLKCLCIRACIGQGSLSIDDVTVTGTSKSDPTRIGLRMNGGL